MTFVYIGTYFCILLLKGVLLDRDPLGLNIDIYLFISHYQFILLDYKVNYVEMWIIDICINILLEIVSN